MRPVMTVWLLAVLGLAACDNGGSAVRTRERDGEAPLTAARPGAQADGTQAMGGADEVGSAPADAVDEAVEEAVRGAPVWSSTRRYTAEENARRAFERNGADFGARTMDAYVAAAHAFIASPPRGTETRRRRNGDTLYYHAASNTFAVATRAGAPRTMFKPDDGADYWARELERLERAN